MRLQTLRLSSFRAHQETEVAFSRKVNLIYGPNGVGKTNILEAIHYLCLSKSFLEAQDQYVVRRGESFFEISGSFSGHHRSSLDVRVAFVPDEGKRIFVNGAPLDRLSDIVGTVPVVVFAPDDYVITAAGPDERRKFLNNILSQARPAYMEDVWAYKRVLRQRNELLSQFQNPRYAMPDGLLESWDAELVKTGSRVIFQRMRFLRDFDRYLAEAYATMEHAVEMPTITYSTSVELDDLETEEDVAQRFRARIDDRRTRDRELGRTGDGPHRDELVFRLNDLEIRRYASQGQHRTFGMALKLAQFFFLRDRLDEMPVLLLDDIFDHLDPSRTQAVLELLVSDKVGQSILTSTRRELIGRDIDFDAEENRVMRLDPLESGHTVIEEDEEIDA